MIKDVHVMMVCKNCGIEIPDHAQSQCSNCQHPISNNPHSNLKFKIVDLLTHYEVCSLSTKIRRLIQLWTLMLRHPITFFRTLKETPVSLSLALTSGFLSYFLVIILDLVRVIISKANLHFNWSDLPDALGQNQYDSLFWSDLPDTLGQNQYAALFVITPFLKILRGLLFYLLFHLLRTSTLKLYCLRMQSPSSFQKRLMISCFLAAIEPIYLIAPNGVNGISSIYYIIALYSLVELPKSRFLLELVKTSLLMLLWMLGAFIAVIIILGILFFCFGRPLTTGL